MKRVLIAVSILLVTGILTGAADASASQGSASRGLVVYRHVCSTCHSLDHVRYEDLMGLGLSVSDIKAYAAQHQVPDGLDDDGDPKTRAAAPSDLIGSPYPGPAMARLANHGALPPDFSRIALTHRGGSPWIARMLQSFVPTPPDTILPPGSYANTAMLSGLIMMPPPLHDGLLRNPDGTPETVAQMSTDVAAFLDWTANPHRAARHKTGVIALLYLAVMTVLAYALKHRVWRHLGR